MPHFAISVARFGFGHCFLNTNASNRIFSFPTKAARPSIDHEKRVPMLSENIEAEHTTDKEADCVLGHIHNKKNQIVSRGGDAR